MSQDESIPIKNCFFCQKEIGENSSNRIVSCFHDNLEVIHIFANSKVFHISIIDRDIPLYCVVNFSNQKYYFCPADSTKILYQENFPPNLENIQHQFSRLTKLLPFL